MFSDNSERTLCKLYSNHSSPLLFNVIYEWPKGQLVICGGKRDGFKSQYCFKLVQGVWEEFPPLPEVRTCATSVWIKNHTQWWLTGGRTDDIEDTSSSVIYDIETESWRVGPKMPQKISGHCLVPLDETSDRFMLLSGYYTLPVIGSTYNHHVYILEGEEWVEQQGETAYRYKRQVTLLTDVVKVGKLRKRQSLNVKDIDFF